MGFASTFQSKLSKRYDVMNVESFPVVFGSLAAALANFVSLTRQSSLFSPLWPIVTIVSTLESWMKISPSVFGLPFSKALCAAKDIFANIFSVVPTFPKNWASAITTGWAAFWSFLFGKSDLPDAPTSYGASKSLLWMGWSSGKSLSANFTGFLRTSAHIAILTIIFAMKMIVTLFTNSVWVFAIWHTPIISKDYGAFKLEAQGV